MLFVVLCTKRASTGTVITADVPNQQRFDTILPNGHGHGGGVDALVHFPPQTLESLLQGRSS